MPPQNALTSETQATLQSIKAQLDERNRPTGPDTCCGHRLPLGMLALIKNKSGTLTSTAASHFPAADCLLLFGQFRFASPTKTQSAFARRGRFLRDPTAGVHARSAWFAAAPYSCKAVTHTHCRATPHREDAPRKTPRDGLDWSPGENGQYSYCIDINKASQAGGSAGLLFVSLPWWKKNP